MLRGEPREVSLDDIGKLRHPGSDLAGAAESDYVVQHLRLVGRQFVVPHPASEFE